MSGWRGQVAAILAAALCAVALLLLAPRLARSEGRPVSVALILAEARVGTMAARFRCIGGVDVDPAAVADFGRLAGVPGTCLDMFDRDQYAAFHGREPPADWRPVPTRFRVISAALAKASAATDRPFRPFRCHDLRHRFAVHRLIEGWDIYDLARYMGHSTVKTTEIYLGYIPGGAPIARTSPASPAGNQPAHKGTIRGTVAKQKPRRNQGNAR